MFKFAYGFIGEPVTSRTHLVAKAIDEKLGVEIFPIGASYGEDVEFQGRIYIVKWDGKSIPFISKLETTLKHISFDQFNQNEWKRKRGGAIKVNALEISHIGFDLKKLRRPSRGIVSYYPLFDNDTNHGYVFKSDVEFEEVISFIKNALPILKFNDYWEMYSNPSLCVEVYLENQKPPALNPDDLEEKIKATVAFLNLELENSNSFLKFLNEYQGPPLTIEKITEKLIDIERVIFYKTQDSYPIQFWKEQSIIDILRPTYEKYAVNLFPNFEQFLLAINNLIRDRYFGRLIYEKYSNSPPNHLCT